MFGEVTLKNGGFEVCTSNRDIKNPFKTIHHCAATGAGVGGAGGSRGGGGGGAAAGGSVLVQGEVGSRNDADVELGLWEGVCDMKRPAWTCVFQLKDKKI